MAPLRGPGRTASSLSGARKPHARHYRPLRNGASFPGNDRASSSTVSCSVLASRRRRAEDPRTLGRQSAEGPSGAMAVQEYETSSPRPTRYRRWCKGEIQRLIAELAEQGLRVLMISSEMEELVEGSQRVVVLRDGRSVAELSGEQKNTKNSARHGGRCRNRRWMSVETEQDGNE